MYVLVALGGPEDSRGHLGGQRVEAVDHCDELGIGQQSGPMQCLGMGPGPGEVVGRQPPVEVG